ncbi:MAG: ChaN family lipoprotein [Bdellovibrionota bacterium]
MAQSISFKLLALAVASLVLGSCQHQVVTHALAGKIWDVHRSTFLTEEALLTALGGYDYVLLGEAHDNPTHHQHQATILSQLKLPAVVMEHLDEAQAKIAQATPVSELESKLAWEKSGWPPFSIFEPVFKAVQQTKFQAGALDSETLKTIRAGKAGPLPAKTFKQFGGLEKRPQWDQELEALLDQSHCGQLPKKLLPGMAQVQKYKDVFMAYQLSRHPKALLLAGAGHTRNDNGVPFYLHRAFPKKKIATVQFVEVQYESAKAEDYRRENADFLWFTGYPARPDPCAAFRRPKVVIDPGHSRESPGVRSATGRDEVRYNDAFSEKLQKLLSAKQSFVAELSRDHDENLSLRERVDKIRALKPDAVLSIHHDSMQEAFLEKRADGGWVTREPTAGFSLFVSTLGAHADRSRTLAELIGKEFVKRGRKPTLHHAEKIPGESRKLLDADLGIYEYNELAVLKNAVAPTVLVELGLIVDEDDEKYLSDAENQNQLAEALQESLQTFLK